VHQFTAQVIFARDPCADDQWCTQGLLS
jgi:hypothetical protein